MINTPFVLYEFKLEVQVSQFEIPVLCIKIIILNSIIWRYKFFHGLGTRTRVLALCVFFSSIGTLVRVDGQLPHSHGLSNNPYSEPNQPYSSLKSILIFSYHLQLGLPKGLYPMELVWCSLSIIRAKILPFKTFYELLSFIFNVCAITNLVILDLNSLA